jgi:hypothetical protein
VLVGGYFGLIPGVSAIFGSNKPRNLGVSYTEADLASAKEKSQLEYAELPADTPDSQSLVRSGSRPITATFSNAEVTALMNDRPFKYWPYKNVQVKMNADGSAEISGQLIKSRLSGYCASIGVDKSVADKVIKYLPGNTVFYVKGRAALSGNKVSVLDPSKVEVGRVPIPINSLLSFDIGTGTALATDSAVSELDSVSGKKAAIISYINSHLAGIKGFFANSAYFSENELHFDGNLNEVEATAR